MNPDARILYFDGERAAREGAWSTAKACFLEAGDAAAEVQLWKSSLRCYRHALEIDLLDREVVARILRFPPRVISGRGWRDYGQWLEKGTVLISRLCCRPARLVSADLGAVVECIGVGPVLELIMSERDLVEARPDGRFEGMPTAMAMIILRRALWPAPRERGDLMSIRVTYEVRERLRLDEHGEWEPIVGPR